MAKQSFSVGQVLTAAQMTSLQQTAMLGGAASAKTANYTLVAADAGTGISMSSTSATTITVNTGLFAAGDTVQITNLNTGVCTITAGTATVNTSASLALAQYESGTLYFTSASASIFIKGAGGAAAGGGLTLLSTTTLTGTSTTLSSISQDYVHLYLRIVGMYNTVTADTRVTLSINNDNDDHYWGMYGSQDSSGTATGAAPNGANFQLGRSSTSSTLANKNNSATFIYNYTSTDPRIVVADSYGVNGGAYWYLHTTGCYMGTSACTSLVIAMQGSSIAGGTAYLYGVK